MKKLYHGSTIQFDRIDLSFAKGFKDFGKGFYATAALSFIDGEPVHEERQ